MSTAIKKKKEEETSVVVPENLKQGVIMEGAEDSDFIPPVMHVFQGTPTEQEKFGQFPLGEVVDTIECRALASKFFTPIKAFKQWVRWEKGVSTPVYSTRDRSEVPEEDLREIKNWRKDENGESIPPRCTETHNWLVAVEGEYVPYLLRFKRTSLEAGKTLNSIERGRGVMGKGPGRYELDTTSKINGEKGVYIKPRVRPAGEPTQEMIDFVATVRAMFNDDSSNIQVQEDNDEYHGDDIPI